MVNGQMVKLRKMLAGRWETQILRTNGKHNFPSVQCLHQSMQVMDRREINFPICPRYEQSPDKW